MNKFHFKIAFFLLLSSIFITGFSGISSADVYDDFTGTSIDSSLWTQTNTASDSTPSAAHSLTESGNSYLHVNMADPFPTRNYSFITATRQFGSGYMEVMKFVNYSTPGYSYETGQIGPSLSLIYGDLNAGGLGTGTYLRLSRMTSRISGSEMFYAALISNGAASSTYQNYVFSDASSGFLEIYNDGVNVNLGYSLNEPQQNSDITWLLSVPAQLVAPDLSIVAWRGSNGTLVADIDYLDVSHNVPEPGTLLLVGFGLLGLGGLRRKMN